MTQEQFDQQIAAINTKLDDIGTAITAEATQIQAFINANPTLDTSALTAVADRLTGIDTSVGEIFTPPVVE